MLILKLEGGPAGAPFAPLGAQCHSSAPGWQGQSGLSQGTVEPWQLMEHPRAPPREDWEKHIYKFSVANQVKLLSISIRRSGAKHKPPAADNPYPGQLFLIT